MMTKIEVNNVRLAGKSTPGANIVIHLNGSEFVSRTYSANSSAVRAARKLQNFLQVNDLAYHIPIIDNTRKK